MHKIPIVLLYSFEKAFVHATTFKTKKGTTVHRKAYTDKRVAKQIEASDRIRMPSIQNQSPKEVAEKLQEERKKLKEKLDEVRKHHEEIVAAKEKGETHSKSGISVDDHHQVKKHEKNLHAKLEDTNHKLMLHENRYELLREKNQSKRKKIDVSKKESKNSQTFESLKDYTDWLRKQPGDIKASHKLNRVDGVLTATWGKPEEEKGQGRTKGMVESGEVDIDTATRIFNDLRTIEPFRGVKTSTEEKLYISKAKKVLKKEGIEGWNVDNAVEDFRRKNAGKSTTYLTAQYLLTSLKNTGNLPFKSGVDKDKTEAEKEKNRSDAMKGNKNAYKGGTKEEPKKSPTPKIEDFGEKIGGARKDQWREKYLEGKDIKDLNDREIVQYVNKDKIWPKPDYEAMVQSGADPVAAFLVKKIRDSFPAKVNIPGHKESQLKAYAEKYVELIEKARDVLSAVKTQSDLKNMFEKIFGDEYEKGHGWKVSGNSPSKAYFFDNKIQKAMRISNWDIAKAEVEVDRGWGYSEPWMRFAKIKHDDKNGYQITIKFEKVNHPKFETEQQAKDWLKNRFEAFKDVKVHHGVISKRNRQTGEMEKKTGYYATKGSYIITEIHSTKEGAEKEVLDRHKVVSEIENKKKGTGKQRFVRPQLRRIERKGSDYRNGKDVTTDKLQKTFGFRGGEFGNWNSQEDRQQSMNHAYDALMDLSSVLGLDPKEISLKGELSVAFGARGQGITGANAHYEANRKVINLTKMKGAGSLAHEWAHAFDDYLMKASGDQSLKRPFATENLHSHFAKDYNLPEEAVNAFSDILKAMKKTKMSLSEYKEKTSKAVQENEKKLKSTLNQFRERLIESRETYNGKKIRAATPEELKKFDEEIVPSIMKGVKKDEKTVPDGKKQFEYLPDSINYLTNVFHKEIKGTNEQSLKNNLSYYYQRLGQARQQIEKGDEVNLPEIDSEYMKGSRRMQSFFGKKDYWTSTVEMFARAFESYIQDKVNAKGNVSDYLVHSTSNGAYKMFMDPETGEYPKPYPEGPERKRINDAFDKFFSKLRDGKNIFPEHKPKEKMAKSFKIPKVLFFKAV